MTYQHYIWMNKCYLSTNKSKPEWTICIVQERFELVNEQGLEIRFVWSLSMTIENLVAETNITRLRIWIRIAEWGGRVSKFPSVKFTLEIEQNGKISFLDCLVTKCDNNKRSEKRFGKNCLLTLEMANISANGVHKLNGIWWMLSLLALPGFHRLYTCVWT